MQWKTAGAQNVYSKPLAEYTDAESDGLKASALSKINTKMVKAFHRPLDIKMRQEWKYEN
jgi:hypothetical protein